ncbi:MAG TPA: cation:proton antiporter [Salinivirga sp.]|uniref:cation:proton antiporter domain-containing protein n=1 Tax=Salinivirga sp. TaxID=1970192 RepID=UPI002B45ACD4|nr:cation:proton antiporter [Salinivirga sp.]HKK57841.1 cation:proton antiporter [Salinivirga sp.]
MHFPVLIDLLIIFSLALLVNIIFQRFNVPSILGFIVAGILAGPHVFGLETNPNDLELLSEIGIMLLLFTIGIEFSLKDLMQIRKTVFLGGGLQVLITVATTFILTFWAGYAWQLSVFFGFLVALSSTAIVLKVLQEQSLMAQPYGRGSLGVLIFQDIIVVPMIMLVPFLTGGMEHPGNELLWMLLKVAGLILFTILGSRYIVPPLLHIVARTQKQDFFILTILIIGFGVAILTAILGLSLALGAFLAGLIISETDYNHEAFGNIVPFRDIFTSFFFVLIGMFLNLDFIATNAWIILLLTVIVLILKTAIVTFSAYFSGYRAGVALTMGVALSQVGEFSILLAQTGRQYDLLPIYYHQMFLSVALMTMVVAPFLIKSGPGWLLSILPSRLYHKRLKAHSDERSVENYSKLENHLVIIGMGQNGHNISHAAEYAKIAHVIIDNDADLVQKEKQNGEPIIFGNAENIAVLKEAGVERAGTVVITIHSASSTYTALRNARRLSENAYIIVRTRHVEELEHLYKAGANDVIPGEFETAVEIFTQVLKHNLVPEEEVRQMAAHMRENGYGIFRHREYETTEPFLPQFSISAVRVAHASEVINKSIGELRQNDVFAEPVLAIQRGEDVVTNPSDNIQLLENDILVVMAKPEQLACKTCVFEPEDTTIITPGRQNEF